MKKVKLLIIDNSSLPEFFIDNNRIDLNIVFNEKIYEETRFVVDIFSKFYKLKGNLFYKNFSLWWLTDHKDFFYSILNLKKTLYYFKDLIKKYSIEEIHIKSDNYYSILLWRFLSKKNNIKFRSKLSVTGFLRKFYQKIFYLLFPVLLLCVYIKKLMIFKVSKPKEDWILFLFISSLWSEKYKKFPLMGNLFSLLTEDNIKVFYADYISHLGLNIKKSRNIRKVLKKYYLPLEYSFSIVTHISSVISYNKIIQKVLINIDNNIDNFSIDKIPINIIKSIYKKVLISYIPSAVFYYNLFEQYLKQLEVLPKAIIHIPEAGFYGRIVSSVCNKNKIPNIGMQHGIIHRYHPTYTKLVNYFEKKNEFSNSLYTPRVDLIVVFGNYFKEILRKFGYYSESSIKVVGCPLYDNNKKIIDKEKILKSFGLKKKFIDKKFILFAGGHDQDSNNYSFLYKLYKFFSNYKDPLVVKVHPQDSINYHKNIIKKVRGEKNIILFQKESPIKLIKICDVLLAVHSTMILEALVLKKPVVKFYLFREKGWINYKNTDAVIKITEWNIFEEKLTQILYNKKYRSEILRDINKFIENYYYKIDNKASLRIKNLIKGLIK